MPSMLGYRFDQRLMDELASGVQSSPPFTLLTIRLFVRTPEEEMRFYTALLGVTPRMQNSQMVMLPLAAGIMLVLQKTELTSDGKQTGVVPQIGQVEFDLETVDIQPVFENAQRLSEKYLCRLASAHDGSLFKFQSTNGTIFCFWQKQVRSAGK